MTSSTLCLSVNRSCTNAFADNQRAGYVGIWHDKLSIYEPPRYPRSNTSRVMTSTAGYLLRVPSHRRKILLDEDSDEWFSNEDQPIGEPVPWFDHSKRAPLVVFGCFADEAITHIADGRKGNSAGRGLVVLKMKSLEPLERHIAFNVVQNRAPPRIRIHLKRVLSSGGKLPPKTLGALVDLLVSLQPELADRLNRFSERRAEIISRFPDTSRGNLAIQKESLATALQIAGIGTDDLLTWSPETEQKSSPRSFLEGLPQAYNREDASLISDLSTLPGFEAVKSLPFAARVFRNATNPSIRLTVIMANRLALEEQTGADLIYYNETYSSFVLVQYKSMNSGSKGAEFRWQENDRLAEEVLRMDRLLNALEEAPDNDSPPGFRLHANPFFLKLCPRIVFNPDDKGLSSGMYLPLELWKCLARAPITEGPQGGRILSYNNAGRWLTNTDFITLVAKAWVGTTAPQSALLETVIKEVIGTGRTVTLAVKRELDNSGVVEH